MSRTDEIHARMVVLEKEWTMFKRYVTPSPEAGRCRRAFLTEFRDLNAELEALARQGGAHAE